MIPTQHLTRYPQPGDQLLADLVDAVHRGAHPEHFLQARESGVTDEEFFEVLERHSTYRQPPIVEYLLGRRLGYTHAEVQQAAAAFLSPLYYDRFRSTGATHDQVIELFSSSLRQPGWYIDLRGAGATHAQAMGLLNQNGLTRLAVLTYAALRASGATHAQAALPAEPANVAERVAISAQIYDRPHNATYPTVTGSPRLGPAVS
jgi:hypothetical protein